MKIKMLFVGLFLVVSAIPSLAAGPYASLAAGVSIIHHTGDPAADATYDPGLALNAGVGFDFDGYRVEGEYGARKAGDASSDETVTSYMVNGYYDIKTKSAVTPYVGAGIGLVDSYLKGNGDRRRNTVFGYQVIAGAGFKVSENIILDISYRLHAGAYNYSDWDQTAYMSSNILGGIRFNF